MWRTFTGAHYVFKHTQVKTHALLTLAQENHQSLCTLINQLETRIGNLSNKVAFSIEAGAQIESRAEDRAKVIRGSFLDLRSEVKVLEETLDSLDTEVTELSDTVQKIEFPEVEPIDYKIDG
jgi:prefoldin subunit 5